MDTALPTPSGHLLGREGGVSQMGDSGTLVMEIWGELDIGGHDP